MSTAQLQLEIVTPENQVVKEIVDYVSCPGIDGEFGVLKNHASLLSALQVGILRYDQSGKNEYVFVSGGFADVNNNVITILAESAEKADSIDKARAQKAQQRAEERLAKRNDDLDVDRAKLALRRALVRQSI